MRSTQQPLCILMLVFAFLSLNREQTCQASNDPRSANKTAILTRLYHENGGENWVKKRNWLQGDPCADRWEGVGCSARAEFGEVGRLSLANNSLTGPFPNFLSDLPILTYLELQYNSLDGTIDNSWGNATDLQWFIISNNNIEGTIPDELCNLQSLSDISFSRNRLHGTIPDCFASLPNLAQLYGTDNEFQGTLPSFHRQSIRDIHFDNANLEGTIPLSLAQCRHLSNLWLGNNSFSGPVDELLGTADWPSVLHISLRWNRFTSSLPRSLDHLQALQSLDMSHNYLSGSIPADLPPNMRIIDLSNNSFSGTIPNSWSIVKSRIQLHHNRLYGTLPDFLSTSYPSRYWGGLDLRYNDFSCVGLPTWCSYPPVGNGICEPCQESTYCCQSHSTAGCDDSEIATCVCAYAPECCTEQWDNRCVSLVGKKHCGHCEDGPCCLNHVTPSCVNRNTSACVCSRYPRCCEQSWSQECVDAIEELECNEQCEHLSNCCTALPTGGCNSVDVSRCTCRYLSNESCCRSQWSAECIHSAEQLGCLSC